MINGIEMLIITGVSVLLGWLANTLWSGWDYDHIYHTGYTDGYNQALNDGRVDSGQTLSSEMDWDGWFRAPF